MRFPWLLRLGTEWKRWKGHGRGGPAQPETQG
jgi:hypothetical protein